MPARYVHPWVRFSAILSYVFVVATFGVVAWALVVKVSADSRLRNEAVIAQVRDGCNHTQLRNSFIHAVAHAPRDRRLARAYFEIVDCYATYRPGRVSRPRTVYLAPDLQRCWNELSGALYWKKHPVTTEARAVRVICRGVPPAVRH